MRYKTYICGPTDCPNDPAFEHDDYFGCVPRDFKERTGKSATYQQHRVATADGDRYYWNGGCGSLRASAVPPSPEETP